MPYRSTDLLGVILNCHDDNERWPSCPNFLAELPNFDEDIIKRLILLDCYGVDLRCATIKACESNKSAVITLVSEAQSGNHFGL